MSGSANILTVLIFDVAVFLLIATLFLLGRKCSNIFSPKFYHKFVPKPLSIFQTPLAASSQAATFDTIDLDESSHDKIPGDEKLEILQDAINRKNLVCDWTEYYEKKDPTPWYKKYLKIYGWHDDEDLAQRCGHESAVYLRFVKMVMYMLFVWAVLACAILIPIHATGSTFPETGLDDPSDWFIATSVQRVAEQPNRLWAHIVIAIVITIGCWAAIFCFVTSRLVNVFNVGEQGHLVGQTTVMFHGLPKSLVTRDDLHRYAGVTESQVVMSQIVLQEYAPRMKLSDELASVQEKIRKVRDPTKIHKRYGCFKSNLTEREYLELKKDATMAKITQWEAMFQQKHHNTMDAMQHKAAHDKRNQLTSSGHAFVTLQSPHEVKTVLRSFSPFHAQPAPEPEEVIWKNIVFSNVLRWIIRIISTIIFIIFIAVFSTPLSVVATLSQFGEYEPIAAAVDFLARIGGIATAILLQYLPTLLLLIVTALIPILIKFGVRQERYFDLSSERRQIMFRIWIFILLNILILPSVAQTTFQALAEYAFTQDTTQLFDRLFLPSGASFFVNYLIQATFLGTLSKLLAPGDYIFGYLSRRKRVDEQDIDGIVQSPVFAFETEYASFLCNIALAMTYSLTSPMIVFFGFVYAFLVFHMDRYNLVHVYRRSERHMAKGVPSYRKFVCLLVALTLISIMIFQFALAAFFVTKRYTAHYIIMFALFLLTLAFTITLCIMIMTSKVISAGHNSIVGNLTMKQRARFAYAYVISFMLYEYVLTGKAQTVDQYMPSVTSTAL